MGLKVIDPAQFKTMKGLPKKAFLRVCLNGTFDLSEAAAELMSIDRKHENYLSFYEDPENGAMYISQLSKKGFLLNKNSLKFSNAVFMKHFMEVLKLPLGKPVGMDAPLQHMRLTIVEAPKVDGFAGLFKIQWNEPEP
jgi:hypothetical protein